MTIRNIDPLPLPPPPRKRPAPFEMLYMFRKNNTFIRAELVDHGRYGFEARITYDDRFLISQTFVDWHSIPFTTPRQAAIHWAEAQRKAIEARLDEVH